MNPPELESILRSAPRPTPPPGLAEKLSQQIRLPWRPRLAEQSSLRTIWLRRWWPTLVLGSGILACAAALVTQQGALRERHELTVVPATVTPPLPAPVEPIVSGGETLADGRRTEILRLKAEIAELQGLNEQIQRLTVENRRLQKELVVAEASLPGISSEDLEAAQVAQARALSIQCVNNLKQIGLALRIWANQNSAFSTSLLDLTNELGSPKFLTCPADTARQAAADWANVGAGNVTYEYLAPGASEQEYTRVAARCPIHGNVLLGDGSVQMSQDDGANLRDHVVQRDGKLYFE